MYVCVCAPVCAPVCAHDVSAGDKCSVLDTLRLAPPDCSGHLMLTLLLLPPELLARPITSLGSRRGRAWIAQGLSDAIVVVRSSNEGRIEPWDLVRLLNYRANFGTTLRWPSCGRLFFCLRYFLSSQL